jgi:hypothetical protein
MGAGARALARLARQELEAPPPAAARRLADAIRQRLGPAAAAVVFYGSCLRRRSDEGVFDFYVLVDDYARALPSRLGARAAAALPPSVYWLECPGESGTLRAKYAVLTPRDFARGAAPGGWRSGIWARFCQPSLAAWARDAAALDALAQGCADAILTAVATIAPLLPGDADAEEFWQRVFRETYAREMRTESSETIAALYRAAPDRYRSALHSALAELEEQGRFRAKWNGERFELDLSPAARRRARHAWSRRRPLAKLVYVGQLVKTAFTFGDWLPYALWKVERHTGARIPYSERQRRHPFVFGWPLLWRVLRNRELR